MMNKTKNTLQTGAKLAIFPLVVAKSTAEPGNSNDLTLAHDTPEACFFMRELHTPKERLNMACSPMVACNGKGIALCCFPMLAVFQPVTRYRPKPGNFLAVALKNLSIGVTAMKSYIFKFLSLTTGKITPPIISTSEAEARKKAGENDRLTMIYRKPNPFPILSYACPMAFANWGVWYA